MLYDKHGKETENKDLAWASSGDRFHIRCCNGRLVNPLDLTSKDSPAGADWKQVSKKAFDLYISFLRTKKVLFLRHAQREVM